MADANYSNGSITDAGGDSSRSDPITLASIVTAAAPLTGLSNNVAYQSTASGIEFNLGSGIYNFSGAQLTLTGGGATSASRFQIGPDSTGGGTATVYIGTDNDTGNSQIENEDFVLNFDDNDFTTSTDPGRVTGSNNWNYLIRNGGRLDVDPESRMIVNIPRQSAESSGGLVPVRNVFNLENASGDSNIRMTINMGRYANDVLYTNPPGPIATTRGGPALANSIQHYQLTSTVPVRDVLYRGDYVDWRPQGSTWAALTGGGFIGDQGIKWLITNVTDALVSDTNPLTFGSFDERFELGIDSTAQLSAASGNGYFELGLSPDSARVNRVVFRNVRGISWQNRLSVWNGDGSNTGRLRVEHHTAQPFHVFDDIQEDIAGARVILNHFYPTYLTTDTGNPDTFFNRNVQSTAVSGNDGIVNIGIVDANYSSPDNSTDTNRPIIVEALELNNGFGTNLIQGSYQSSQNHPDNVAHNEYTVRSATETNQATYSAFAYGHMPTLDQNVSWMASSAEQGGPQSMIEIPLERDMNITETNAALVPARASNMDNVYDMLQLWATNNRTTTPITVVGSTLQFGNRRVTLNPSTTVTAITVTPTTMTVPVNTPFAATSKYDSLGVATGSGQANPGFTTSGVDLQGVSIVGLNSPNITINGLNTSTFNTLAGRLDLYNNTGGTRSLTNTLLASVTDRSMRSFSFNRSGAFANIGPGGSITDIVAVYTRPGIRPITLDIPVNLATDATYTITELPEPYPLTANLTENNQPTWTCTAAFNQTTRVLTATIGGGGTNTALSDTQLNRLLMENLYGSEAFNQFVYNQRALNAMGSRGEGSYWFADSTQFQTTIASGAIRAGYIENISTNLSPPPFNDPQDVVQGSVTGSIGVFHAPNPDAFDLSAVVALTADQTGTLQNNFSTFQGDPDGTPDADQTTLRSLSDSIRTTRNTILGNL